MIQMDEMYQGYNSAGYNVDGFNSSSTQWNAIDETDDVSPA